MRRHPIARFAAHRAASPRPETHRFSDLLTDAVGKVSELEDQAVHAVDGLMSGSGVDVHQAMIAAEKASMAFEMALAVRNKAIQSYQVGDGHAVLSDARSAERISALTTIGADEETAGQGRWLLQEHSWRNADRQASGGPMAAGCRSLVDAVARWLGKHGPAAAPLGDRCVAHAGALLGGLFWYGLRTDWRTLYAGLDPDDARQIGLT